jgi:hypothetical protein
MNFSRFTNPAQEEPDDERNDDPDYDREAEIEAERADAWHDQAVDRERDS